MKSVGEIQRKKTPIDLQNFGDGHIIPCSVSKDITFLDCFMIFYLSWIKIMQNLKPGVFQDTKLHLTICSFQLTYKNQNEYRIVDKCSLPNF